MKLVIQRRGLVVRFLKADGSAIAEHKIYGTSNAVEMPVDADLKELASIIVSPDE